MDRQVPLVVPEVNGDDLINHRGIISIPNCSTTPLVMVLKPLVDTNPIRKVIVDTYQSVSGTGSAAVSELQKQTSQILHDESVNPSVYPHPIALNLFPHIDEFQENGYTKEEMKMVEETRKILGLPTLPLSVTCVRVPINVGHSEAVHIEFEYPINPATVREILSAQAGIEILDDPSINAYPTPAQAEGSNEVLVGRIRQDLSNPNGISLWISCDNLRKGAALNAIQIAKEIVDRGLLVQ
jgi:aspartate-semialdehyde dehydrogenase